MFTYSTNLFVRLFCIKIVLLSSMIFLFPINASERENTSHDPSVRMRKAQVSDQGGSKKKLQRLQKSQVQHGNQLQLRDRLQTFVCELGQKKDDLQQTYLYWTLSSAHAVYSVYNSSEDAIFRCLHAAITVAPYATPYLPIKAQPYYQKGLNGASTVLEGIRAMVYTKRWAWEQILGYSCLCFMTTMPEIIQSREMQGGIYFFFKTAGFYSLNYSLPYLPDSLWQEIWCYSTSCHEAKGGTLSLKGPNMNSVEKKEVFKALEVAYHDADYCQQDIVKTLDQMGLSGSFQKEINACHSVVSSWESLKPKFLGNQTFSIEPSSSVLIVNQRQYAVAHRGDSINVLVTANLMKCVGMALYNVESNSSGLVHLDGENIRYLDAYLEGKIKPRDNINDIQKFVFDVAGRSVIDKIRATIVSGYSAHINYFKKYLEILGIKNVEIVHNPEWGKAGNGYEVWELDKNTGAPTRMVEVPKGSIAIDCQNGKLSYAANEPQIRKAMGMPPKGDEKPHGLKKVDLSKKADI